MSPASFNVIEWLAVATALVACVTDVTTRRVPNYVTFGAALIGIAAHGLLAGPRGLAFAVLGWTVGLLLFLPLFALRGIGGGDVKLLAAFGSFVGPRLVIWSGLYGALAGGVLAVALTLSRGVLGRTLSNMNFILTTWRAAGIAPVDGFTLDNSASVRLPYAVPLACGLVVALWLQA